MADYNKNTGSSVDDNLLKRVSWLEQEVAALRSNKLLTVDRLAPTQAQPAVEGQIGVDSANENFMWYSNGHWREFSVLNWVWAISFSAIVPGGTGASTGAAAKYATGASIHFLHGDFSIVNETFNSSSGWFGTPYSGDVLKVPAGTYLAIANLISFADVTETFTGPWTYRVFAKDPTTGWDHEDDPVYQTDTWRLEGAPYDPGGYTLDPKVIPETHIMGAPIVAADLGDGYGLISLHVINYDTQQHLFSGGFLFMVSMSSAANIVA